MKRIISLLMSAVLIFSVTVPAFASSKSVPGLSDCDPVILIRGMDFGNVMLDVGTENERKVNNFSASTIVTGVAATLIKWLAVGDKNAAVDSLIETAYSLLKYNSMNENGDPAYNTGMIKYPFSKIYTFNLAGYLCRVYTDFLYQKFHFLPYTLAFKSFLERFKPGKGSI